MTNAPLDPLTTPYKHDIKPAINHAAIRAQDVSQQAIMSGLLHIKFSYRTLIKLYSSL